MMDFFEISTKRYSHKGKYLAEAVPLSDLEKIAQSGIEAPCGNNRQSIRLIILPDRAAVAPLHAAVPAGQPMETAPAAIAVLTDGTVPRVLPQIDFDKEDYAAAVENMLLAAVSLGYVSVWLDSPYWSEEKQSAALKALGAPDTHHLWAVLPIGKPDGEGARREKIPYAERVFYGTYGKQK